MKVLHVIPSLWHGDGGPSHALRAMERALAAQGIDMETAATDDAGPGRRNGRAGEGAVEEEGAVRRYFAKRSDFYKWSPGFARWIAGAARGYDLLHLHALFSHTTSAAARAARRHDVPYVVRPLGTLAPWGIAHRRPWLKQISLRVVEAPLLRSAAAVHFTSEEERRQAMALGVALRPVVIPLGVEVPAVAPRVARGGTVRALYLSRLDPKKNVEGLLDALAAVRPRYPQLELVIAGAGEPAYVRTLHERAASLGLKGHVHWLGPVAGADKRLAFEQADFFVLASHSENFGIAAAEALAHGLPCLLGEGVAIAAEVVAAGAGISVKPDAASVAAGLGHMIAPTARACMSPRALQLARERYSIDAMGARLKLLYSDILCRRGLPEKR